MAAYREAQRQGLRAFGMLCPLSPKIADDPREIEELVQFVLDDGAEEVFVEPINGRGKSQIHVGRGTQPGRSPDRI